MTFPFKWTACILLAATLSLPAFASPNSGFRPLATITNPVTGDAEGSEGDLFGSAVALYDKLMVSCAPFDQVGTNLAQGAAYVFQRQGTRWQQLIRLTAPDGFEGQHFCTSASMSGNRLAIGAQENHLDSSQSDSAIYVFRGDGAVWQLEAKLEPPEGNAADPQFGRAVAISGDYLLSGSTNRAGAQPGRVFTYRRSGNTWQPAGTITGQSGERAFGSAVAIDGTRAVIGAQDSRAIAIQQGAAYVVERTVDGWTLPNPLAVTQFGPFTQTTYFGTSVAVSGDTILVGAPYASRDNRPTGAAFAFVLQNGQWMQQSMPLVDPSGDGGDRFGVAVAIDGDRAAIGADGDENNSGSLRVFTRSNGSWLHAFEPMLPDSDDTELFGNQVALHGDTILVGAPLANGHGETSDPYFMGATYTFANIGGDWQHVDTLRLPDGADNDRFGFRIAADGDTMLVAAPFQERGTADQAGVVYVYRHSASGWQFEAKLIGPNTAQYGDLFGWSVAVKGDTAAVGAIYVDAGVPDAGVVYLFKRTGTSWAFQGELQAPDRHAYDNFGSAVAFDLQSNDRIIVGAWRADAGGVVDGGKTYVFRRESNVWSLEVELYAAVPKSGSFLGYSVALSGTRAYAGAPHDDLFAGKLYLFERDGNGPLWVDRGALINPLPTRDAFDLFGIQLVAERVGNRDRLYVAAPGATIGDVDDAGGVFRIDWSTNAVESWQLTALPTPAELEPNAGFGHMLALRGGHLLVGAPYADLPFPTLTIGRGPITLLDAGVAYFYPNGDAERAQRLESAEPQLRANFGRGLAIGPLANGYPRELMIGVPLQDRPDPDAHADNGLVERFDERLFRDGFE